jgi:TPP-dependent pyruvate/acetoin dehydrogenase alpha subunit
MSEPDLGFISTSAIVGGSISLATGAGFALKTQGGDAIAVGLFGDGALEEGVSYESLNLGALYELPVVYVCENNSTGALGSAGGGFPTSVSAVDDLTDIPKTFGIPVETVDGRDPDAVAEVVAKGIEHTRARKGPFFVHVVTARYAGTQPLWPTLPTGPTDISMAWDDSGMSGEHEQWFREHDPVLGYARKLLADGDITQDELT